MNGTLLVMYRPGYSPDEGTYNEMAHIDCRGVEPREVEIKLAAMIRDGWGFRPRGLRERSGQKPAVVVYR